MEPLKNKVCLFILQLIFIFCRAENIPSSASYDSEKDTYSLVDESKGKPIKKIWSYDGYGRTEIYEENGKEITEYYRFDELERKTIVESLPTSERVIREYNMKNIELDPKNWTNF